MFINSLPKIELHCHLDGSIRPKTIFNLAKKNNISLPTDSFDSFKEYVSINGQCDNLKTYLKKFVYPNKIMQTKENLEQVGYEFIKDLEKDNIKYVEVRFAPALHQENQLTITEVISAVNAGLKRGSKETGILYNIIISGMRHWSVEKNIDTFKKAEKFLGHGVIAVDLAGNEADFPPELHKEAFTLAKKMGFNITVHAGETGSYKNIKTAICDLHATRIGHGISAINDIETINLLKERKVALEICPTSNINTSAYDSFKEHPIKKFYQKGVITTLNTDNMTVSNTTLTKEYEIIRDTFNFQQKDFERIYNYAVKSSFADSKVKIKLLNLL